MVNLKSVDDYHTIRKRLKEERKYFTNDMLSDEDVKRFIAADRVQYAECEAGVTFLIDEDTYYKAVLYIDPAKIWKIDQQNKPVIMRTRYQKDKKKKELLQLEQQMQKNGFLYQDTAVEIRLDTGDRKEHYEKQYQRAQKLLERMNCRTEKVCYRYHEQIQKLIKQQNTVQYFHLEYKSEDEIKAEYANGNHTCILNSEDELLAYGSGYELNGCWYGDLIVVKEEYKMYGLAPMFLYGCVHNRKVNTIKGVILTDNKDSIRFHKKMGWTFTNKYIDCWLMEPGQKEKE